MKRTVWQPAMVVWCWAVLGVFATAVAVAEKPPERDAQDASSEARATGDVKSPPVTQASGKPAANEKSKFLRLRRAADRRPLALETSVTRYVGKSGGHSVRVDLIGAVHVGEKDYYAKLNERFTTYDAVLYELVAPEGTRITPGMARKSNHPVSYLQKMMQSVLELEFQLDQIDYQKKNLVHADMSPTEFAKSMSDRGESFLQMFFRMMGQSMAMQAKQTQANSDIQMLVALFAKDRAMRLKRIMAEQFENLEGQLSVLSGPEGSTIITERNKKALAVLEKELKAGKRRLAIFYGAGHLADMEQRLIKDFGLKEQKQDWLVAWSLTEKKQRAGKRKPRRSDDKKPAAEKPAAKKPGVKKDRDAKKDAK